MAGLGGAFSGLLGNSVLQQLVLYNVVGQLIGGALAPVTQSIANTVWPLDPVVPLSPADAAEAVLRTVLTLEQGKSEAAMSGVNAERFNTLYLLAGNAPAPEELAVALRRGFINQHQYDTGIAQGRLRNEWGPTVKQLAVQQPSPTDALEAYLEGQLSEQDARSKWAAFGGDPANFDWLFNTRGQAPTPVQALELLNRGIIQKDGSGPQSTSYTQAFLEGPWRNKWLQPFLALAEYLPPPRTVTALLREGTITPQRATELLKKQGLSNEDAAAYVASASAQKTGAHKTLALGIVEALYRDKLITKTAATTDLEALGYDAAEAGFILSVVDAAQSQHFLTSAVTKTHSLYIAYRIDKTEATKALTSLQVPAAGQTALLALWDVERGANTPTLTPSQIAKAFKDQIITRDDTYKRLEQHGYAKQDAWIFVSQYLGAKDGTGPP